MKNNRHVKINCSLAYNLPIEEDDLTNYLSTLTKRTQAKEFDSSSSQ